MRGHREAQPQRESLDFIQQRNAARSQERELRRARKREARSAHARSLHAERARPRPKPAAVSADPMVNKHVEVNWTMDSMVHRTSAQPAPAATAPAKAT